MKKIFVLALILMCVFVIASCDNSQNDTPNGSSSGDTNPVTDAHVHEYGEWSIVKNSTCSVKGEEERICSCGAKETQYIDTLAHTEVIDSAVMPTYTSEGKTEGKHCSVCNEVIVRQESIPKLKEIIIKDVTFEKKDGVLSIGDTITINVDVDTRYDVFIIKIQLKSAQKPENEASAWVNIEKGDPKKDIYTATLTVSEKMFPGDWYLSWVYVEDQYSAFEYYRPEQNTVVFTVSE
ncbi:MAG: hypothetical protein IJW83_05340 [Clostridia bacterium]|nr:hypothetical protein [Clostridia bacterium]